MGFKSILASALMVVCGCPALAASAADNALLEMREAFRKNDRARLSALLPQTRGHALETWAAYWELKARLDSASEAEVQAFIARFKDSYLEDRLRNDWLLLLGARRDWPAFAAEHPRFRMNDDREVRCYALLIDHLKHGSDVSDEVRRLWLAQGDADEGCTVAADRLIGEKKLDEAVAWRRARGAMEAGRMRALRAAVGIVAADALESLKELDKNAARWLAKKPAKPNALQREFIVLALIRIARAEPDVAAELVKSPWGERLTAEQRGWLWGVIGKQAALRLSDEAPVYFARAVAKDLNDDLLAFKARAALRAGRHQDVLTAIDAMTPETRKDASWVYWKARARMALDQHVAPRPDTPAHALLSSIASPRGFYEMLALEDLGQPLAVPARPPAPTAPEREAARANPSLQRALLAIKLGLRAEGVREWNYATNLAQPGGMGERELLAAAQLACEHEVWDRCINTSERTPQAFDIEQRFPLPHRDAVLKKARAIGLDPAYVYGLIRQESRFIMDARSHVGASGLMQLMPATAKWTAKKIGLAGFTPDAVNDRDINIALGTGYLKLVLDDFEGSLALAAAAYNAGPGRSRNWRNGPVLDAAVWAENIPFNETRDYVKKVLANTTMYAALLSGQPQSLRERLGQVGPRGSSAAEPNRELP